MVSSATNYRYHNFLAENHFFALIAAIAVICVGIYLVGMCLVRKYELRKVVGSFLGCH